MLCTDRSAGSGDRGLDVAESGVDPFEGGRFRRSRSRAGSDDRVIASGACDGGEAGETVAYDGAGGSEAPLCDGRDGGTAKTGEAAQLEANGFAFRRGLDGGDERRLAGGTASALLPDGWFRGGVLRHAGLLGFITGHVGDRLTLAGHMPELEAAIDDPEVVAVVDLAPGCDLRRDTCAAKFGNLLNFGGFPDIPGRNPFGGTSIV